MAKRRTDEELIEIAKSCKSRREMRETQSAALLAIYRRKLQSSAFAHMEKERQYVSECDGTKKCYGCEETKHITDFYKINSNEERRQGRCKKCQNKESLEWGRNNVEKRRESCRKSSRKYPEKVRERANIKRKKNPHVAAARDMLKRILSLTGQRKNTKTEACLGYSFYELRSHISSKFEEGMTWDNHGEWHIDHIIPVNIMVGNGITDPSEINALANLRPLWAEDNLSRSRKARSDNRASTPS